MTLSRVAGFTSGLPCSTSETVDFDTPAACAMSTMVTRVGAGSSATVDASLTIGTFQIITAAVAAVKRVVPPWSPSACRPPTAGSRTIGSARPRPIPGGRPAPFPRIAYAAAHVVADPMADLAPWQQSAVDWDATMAFRRHLWGLGFKIAEAMDTSQRGMGLDWPTARELIRRSLAEARTIAGRRPRLRRRHRPAGAGRPRSISVRGAYEEQLEAVEAAGGRAILMASRALVRGGTLGRRLSGRLWRADPAGSRAGDPALAGRHVRPVARRLLGQPRRRRGDRDGADADPRARGTDRRHQDLAARREPRDRAAAAPAAGGEDVHRRRLQLCAADRG